MWFRADRVILQLPILQECMIDGGMHVYMYVCIDVCVHICMYACMYIRACVYMYARMYACTSVHIYVCIYTYVHACVCVCVLAILQKLLISQLDLLQQRYYCMHM